MVVAARSRLKDRRDLVGLSQKKLAAAIPCNVSTVRRWENGERSPRSYQRRPLADALQVPLQPTSNEHGLDWYLVRDDQIANGGTVDDVLRREFIAGVAVFASTAAALPAGGRVGVSDVAHLRQKANALYALDDARGGGVVYTEALKQLADVHRVLDGASYGPTVGRDIQVLAGQLTEIAGWSAYDAGQQPTARQLYTEALTIADLAENNDLRVLVMATMSLQAANHGRGWEAVQLAEGAQRVARPFATPRLLSLLAAREAAGHARSGDATACHTAWLRAERLLDDDNPDEPGWLKFWGPADLMTTAGSAQSKLGLTSESVRSRRAALDLVDPAYPRNRATYLAGLSGALVADGDVDEGASVASSALDALGDISSGRVHDQLNAVRLELEPFSSRPAVEGFLVRA